MNYLTYDSNESMYAKLKTGGISVDLIIPSDYMIARLIQEDMLLPLNFDNIPNYQYIDETYRNTVYDPENRYSVPYTWGTVGLFTIPNMWTKRTLPAGSCFGTRSMPERF